jgi:hypothetical protein
MDVAPQCKNMRLMRFKLPPNAVTGDCTPAERVLPGASGCGSGTLLLTGALEERDYLASLVRAFHMEGHI